MHILNNNIIRKVQICMCKVPDRTYSVLNQHIRNFNCFLFRNRQNCNINLIILNERFQIIHHTDRNSTDGYSLKSWIHIKDSFQNESTVLKGCIISQCLPKITCTNDNNIVVFFQS